MNSEKTRCTNVSFSLQKSWKILQCDDRWPRLSTEPRSDGGPQSKRAGTVFAGLRGGYCHLCRVHSSVANICKRTHVFHAILGQCTTACFESAHLQVSCTFHMLVRWMQKSWLQSRMRDWQLPTTSLVSRKKEIAYKRRGIWTIHQIIMGQIN